MQGGTRGLDLRDADREAQRTSHEGHDTIKRRKRNRNNKERSQHQHPGTPSHDISIQFVVLPLARVPVVVHAADVLDGVDHRPRVERDLGERYGSYEGAHEYGEGGGVAGCAEYVGSYGFADIVAEHEDSDGGCCGVEQDLGRLVAFGTEEPGCAGIYSENVGYPKSLVVFVGVPHVAIDLYGVSQGREPSGRGRGEDLHLGTQSALPTD